MKTDRDITELLAKSIAPMFGVNTEEILSKTRVRGVLDARYVIFAFLRQHTGWSLKRIGRSFPQVFDHSTVINGIRVLLEVSQYDDVYFDRQRHSFTIMKDEHDRINKEYFVPDLSLVHLTTNEA